MHFNTWIDTLVIEKRIDLEESFTVLSPNGTPNYMTIQNVIDVMKDHCPAQEQTAIKNMVVQLDFKNQAIVPYFKHLAKAIAVDL